ncbi:hypothetical protein GCM10025863_23090 [Microbacterium suwonense]|uniref:histidine kinase n=2 Tax=Microbacterium suwonense TaxID=683047 RepID=A0ABM8FVD0_9MICO|nr:hypothetical protein GCM10025863_23090 [Microbacterium suwonense]
MAILMPFTIGALIHDARQQRQHRAEKLQLTLQNAALIDEQSALRERERIADELHDRLGHRLTAIEIQARLLLEHRAPAGVLDEKVAIMRTQARDALDDVRAIIQLPAMLGAREAEEAPQGKSLLQQAKDFTKAVGVQATLPSTMRWMHFHSSSSTSSYA